MYKINLEENIAMRISVGKNNAIRLYKFELYNDDFGMYIIDYGIKKYLYNENSVYI